MFAFDGFHSVREARDNQVSRELLFRKHYFTNVRAFGLKLTTPVTSTLLVISGIRTLSETNLLVRRALSALPRALKWTPRQRHRFIPSLFHRLVTQSEYFVLLKSAIISERYYECTK
jgi:hypothetical protein